MTTRMQQVDDLTTYLTSRFAGTRVAVQGLVVPDWGRPEDFADTTVVVSPYLREAGRRKRSSTDDTSLLYVYVVTHVPSGTQPAMRVHSDVVDLITDIFDSDAFRRQSFGGGEFLRRAIIDAYDRQAYEDARVLISTVELTQTQEEHEETIPQLTPVADRLALTGLTGGETVRQTDESVYRFLGGDPSLSRNWFLME